MHELAPFRRGVAPDFSLHFPLPPQARHVAPEAGGFTGKLLAKLLRRLPDPTLKLLHAVGSDVCLLFQELVQWQLGRWLGGLLRGLMVLLIPGWLSLCGSRLFVSVKAVGLLLLTTTRKHISATPSAIPFETHILLRALPEALLGDFVRVGQRCELVSARALLQLLLYRRGAPLLYLRNDVFGLHRGCCGLILCVGRVQHPLFLDKAKTARLRQCFHHIFHHLPHLRTELRCVFRVLTQCNSQLLGNVVNLHSNRPLHIPGIHPLPPRPAPLRLSRAKAGSVHERGRAGLQP
mmetsp:Transcript_15574/g.39481  ORF Transcript_15574/g.39481 Transcript_15574/m.39481 type:complete len:292 (+) Transcript_15574:773-1648(+)